MGKNVLILGAGASGLTAAITAASMGNSVTVIDKRDVAGKKILATGNGRCNITNEDQDMLHFHSSDEPVMKKILSEVSYEEMLEFFSSLGIKLRSKNGYMYPFSNQAASVQKALITRAKELGVNFKLQEEFKSLSGNTVVTDKGKYRADKIIISCGTPAGYKNDGAGTELVSKLKVKTERLHPALTYLTSDAKICRYWAGVRVEGKISLGRYSYSGELMLTADGVSGIAAFQLAHHFGSRKGKVALDFMPDLSLRELSEYLRDMQAYPERKSDALYGILPVKLSDSLYMELFHRLPSLNGKYADKTPLSALNDAEIEELSKLIKNFEINVTGTGSVSDAQVCAGGIRLTEITTDCELKSQPGVYVTGEILDVNGDCGGYNLTWAFKTGIIAGRAAGGRNDQT